MSFSLSVLYIEQSASDAAADPAVSLSVRVSSGSIA
jgi:hypothetical protein